MTTTNSNNTANETETLVSQIMPTTQPKTTVAGIWPIHLSINKNKFIHKSLSDWAVNIGVGCVHGCRFCYVPDTSTKKQAGKLAPLGVTDPDADWGNYLLLRKWDEDKFLKSVLRAELETDLSSDGNRAVMYCTTTDPYQTVSGVPNQKELNEYSAFLVQRSLELIRDSSTLHVRILTRSPLARRDFELFKSFGNRLVFGMSLPTLKDKLAKVYEPGAPGVQQRLKTLQAAKKFGLHVYVAVAPTYPECDAADLRATLQAVKELDPVTISHEQINIRAENVARIEGHAKELGVELNTSVFETPAAWRRYSIDALRTVHRLMDELGMVDRLKLWPDAALAAKGPFLKIRKEEFEKANPSVTLTKNQAAILKRLNLEEHQQFQTWLQGWWDKVSEWPGVPTQISWARPALLASSPFDPVPLERIREIAAKEELDPQNTKGSASAEPAEPKAGD
jgi:DNA repair photolyase